LGLSATIASVVISRPAIEAASCKAVRTTLVGSMTHCRQIVSHLGTLEAALLGDGWNGIESFDPRRRGRTGAAGR
jgi:hypothetical protein